MPRMALARRDGSLPSIQTFDGRSRTSERLNVNYGHDIDITLDLYRVNNIAVPTGKVPVTSFQQELGVHTHIIHLQR